MNNVIVLGGVTGEVDNDLWIVKLDPEGSMLWSTTVDLGGNDGANGVAIDARRNILVAGSFKNGEDTDVWVRRLAL